MTLVQYSGPLERMNRVASVNIPQVGYGVETRISLSRGVPWPVPNGVGQSLLEHDDTDEYIDGPFTQGDPVLVKLGKIPLEIVLSIPLLRYVKRWFIANELQVLALPEYHGYIESLVGCRCVNSIEKGPYALELDYRKSGVHTSRITAMNMSHQSWTELALQGTNLLSDAPSGESRVRELSALDASLNDDEPSTPEQVDLVRDIIETAIPRLESWINGAQQPQVMIDQFRIHLKAVLGSQKLGHALPDAKVPLWREITRRAEDRRAIEQAPEPFGDKLEKRYKWLLLPDTPSLDFANKLAESLPGVAMQLLPGTDLAEAHRMAELSEYVIGFAYSPQAAAALSATGGPGFLFTPDDDAQSMIWLSQFGKFNGIDNAPIGDAIKAGDKKVARNLTKLAATAAGD